jgi:hypothetical protein
MSGGRFEYMQDRITDISVHIEDILERQGKEMPKNKRYYYFNGEYGPLTYETYPEEIQKRMKEAIYALKKAYIYAKRVDWYLSGDDGEEQFLKRLDEQLKQLDDEHLPIS